MSDIIRKTSQNIALPEPQVPISFRLGTLDDLPAIDALQKQYHKELGFFPRAQMEGYLKSGWVIVAIDQASGRLIGYCASRDRYLKRDELGVIFQLCVDPTVQRQFIGAALLREVFERSPYGCRLYCCWCAQDLAANHFWESMGFVPLAFRAGSAKKSRTHIFWQKRIVDGDETTPWWFPSQTSGGAIGDGRLVLPIPAGMSWKDEMPRILLQGGPAEPTVTEPKQLGHRSRKQQEGVKPSPTRTSLGGWGVAQAEPEKASPVERKPRPRIKLDPKLIVVTRELRDRWLEEVNAGRFLAMGAGKYDARRRIGDDRRVQLPGAGRRLLRNVA